MSVYLGNNEVGIGVYEKPPQKPYTGFKMTWGGTGQGEKVRLKWFGSSSAQPIQTPSLLYSLDNASTWHPYTLESWVQLNAQTPTVCFMATPSGNTSFSSRIDGAGYRFTTENHIPVYLKGNIMSLLSQDYEAMDTVPDYAFKELFKDNDYATNYFSIVAWDDPLRLPAKTVGFCGYASMFSGQYYLGYMPDLPATSVDGHGYDSMFSSINFQGSLSNKVLPCLNPGVAAYKGMFVLCRGITETPIIMCQDENYLATCNEMFSSCNDLTTARFPNASCGAVGIESSTFSNCYNLKYVEVGVLDADLQLTQPSGVIAANTDFQGVYPSQYMPNGWTYVCKTTGEVLTPST